jgi:hypothetical protein
MSSSYIHNEHDLVLAQSDRVSLLDAAASIRDIQNDLNSLDIADSGNSVDITDALETEINRCLKVVEENIDAYVQCND